MKFKENVLVNSGVCVKGEASQKLTLKDGVPTDTIFFLLASDERKESNVSFTIKNEGEDTSSTEDLGRVVITGDGFTLDTDGSAYLGDGHYTAHRYNFPKNGFNQTGNEERDQHNIDIIADSLLNKTEDIEFNVVNGKPDRDLVFVKVPVNRPAEEEGATAKIKVVDKATGKNIEGIDVVAISGLNATAKSIAKWNTSDEAEKSLTGLAGDSRIVYGIELSNVPKEYEYNKQYIFSFAKDSKEESWVVELEKKNGPVAEEGATAKIKVVDKATGKNIEGIDVVAISGLNATAKSIAKWNTSDEAEKSLTGLAGDPRVIYGIELSNVPKEYEYNKQYIFSFAKDSKEESWVVELEKKPGTVAEEGEIGFRLYSRYKGLWDRKDNGMVGYVIITDGADDFIGKYKLDEMISLPDGKYKAEIEVNSKGYSCFSEQKIQFTVDEGKAVENLDFNVERWNFNENGSGDANGDGTVDISDAVLIMQSMANPSKYGANGTDKGHLTADGSKRADVDGGGVTNKDALTIQQYLLGMFNFE
ncbi:MAG: dockerin type I repeat-containing protein [Ruminococcus flavefaciens]